MERSSCRTGLPAASRPVHLHQWRMLAIGLLSYPTYMKVTRRHLTALLPALAAAQTAAPQPKVRNKLASKAYRFEDLPEKVNGQNKSRNVFDGLNHAGVQLDIHITELGPGQMP